MSHWIQKLLYLRQIIDVLICQYNEYIFDGKSSFTYLKDDVHILGLFIPR